jgi:uncharacterized protein involved in exopolysaccharide biosynthesis
LSVTRRSDPAWRPLGRGRYVKSRQAQADTAGIDVTEEPQECRATAVVAPPAVAASLPRDDDEIDLRWVQQLLARRRGTLIAATVLGVLVTAVLALVSPRQYEAMGTLLVSGSSGTGSGNANAVRTVLTAPSVLGGVNQTLSSEGHPPVDAGAIAVDPSGAASLVRLRVRLGDPGAAQRAAILLVERGGAAAREMRAKVLKNVRPTLDTELQEAAKQLEASEQRLLEFRRQARLEVLQSDLETELTARRGTPGNGTGLSLTRDKPSTEELQRLLNELYQRELELKRVEREVDVAERVYAARMVRARESDALQSVPLFELAESVAPGASLGRDLTRKLALGLVVGLLLGLALIVMAEAVRPTMARTPSGA